jgi:hypothetical protein
MRIGKVLPVGETTMFPNNVSPSTSAISEIDPSTTEILRVAHTQASIFAVFEG